MPRSPVVDVPAGSALTVLVFSEVAESETSAPPTVDRGARGQDGPRLAR